VSSLALDYGLNSRYGTSQDLYDQAYRGMSPSSSDATAADVLGAWLGIAWTLRLLGKYNEAYDVLLDARDYARTAKGLGPESLATLRSINAYTIVCRRLPERREEALADSRTAFEVASRRFGPEHPDTLAIAVSLSNLLRTISDDYHPEALALAEKTVESYPGVYGDSHPYNFGCRSNLALLHRVTGSPEKARGIDELALAGLTRVLGPDHHFTLTVAMNLASDFAVLGLPEEARRLGEATLPKLTALLGPDHTHTLGCAANLALDLIATGDEKAGKTLQEETLEAYEAAQGVDFPDYVVARESVDDTTRRLDPDFDPPPI